MTAMRIRSGVGLAQALEAEGIPLPKNCRTAKLVSTVDSALTLEFECFVDDADIVKIGKALQRLGQDS